jgi:hypothetical protein
MTLSRSRSAFPFLRMQRGWWIRGVASTSLVALALLSAGCGAGDGEAAATLPFSDGFSGDCQWPQGSNGDSFSYGCANKRYEMTLNGDGVQGYHVTQDFDLHSGGLHAEATGAVQTGTGVKHGVLLGIGCLKDDHHGYVAAYGNYDHRWGVARLEDDFTWIANQKITASPPSGPSVRLGIICANQPTGETLIAVSVNGNIVGSTIDETRAGFESYDGVFLYANTYPGLVTFDDLDVAVPTTDELRFSRSLLPG